jgi:hypothetical protein
MGESGRISLLEGKIDFVNYSLDRRDSAVCEMAVAEPTLASRPA